MSRFRAVFLVMCGIVAAFALAFVLTPPRGARSMREFNPPRLADLEVRMWQAYYAKERLRLFGLLVTMLHEQYHYSWATATLEGFHLARAAATFGDLRGGYDVVLPDLEAAYAKAKSWTQAEFDPRAVARAELAWWVARRVPGQNSAEQIGGLIADGYALLYRRRARASKRQRCCARRRPRCATPRPAGPTGIELAGCSSSPTANALGALF